MNNVLYAFMLQGKVNLYAQHIRNKDVNFYNLVNKENLFSLEPLFRMTPKDDNNGFVLFSIDSLWDDFPIGEAKFCNETPSRIHFKMFDKDTMYKSLILDKYGCYDLIYDRIMRLENAEVIEPVKVCSLIHPKLAVLEFRDNTNVPGTFEYLENQIHIHLYGRNKHFEGYQEYFPVKDHLYRRSTLCVQFTDNFIAQEIFDMNGKPYSMVVDDRSIRIFNGNELAHGEQWVYQAIMQGKLDPEIHVCITNTVAQERD